MNAVNISVSGNISLSWFWSALCVRKVWADMPKMKDEENTSVLDETWYQHTIYNTPFWDHISWSLRRYIRWNQHHC